MAQSLCQLKKKGGSSGGASGSQPGDYAILNLSSAMSYGNGTTLPNVGGYGVYQWNVDGYNYFTTPQGLSQWQTIASTDGRTWVQLPALAANTQYDISSYKYLMGYGLSGMTISK